MADILRAAVVQMDVRIGDLAANRTRMIARLKEAADRDAKLVVFPECALTGYCFTDADEGRSVAVTPDTALTEFRAACRHKAVSGIVGFLESGEGERFYNSAALVHPDGSGGIYRKTHLPTLGVDRFVTPGDALPVFDAPWGRLGMLICYDVRFSEAARSIGLQGADILALPTNWPEGAESSPGFITRARAWESRVYLLAANRVGVERGRRFIGSSQIVAPSGEILAQAGPDEEAILYADLDLAQARRKRIVFEPGEWELDVTEDRRPELYSALMETRP